MTRSFLPLIASAGDIPVVGCGVAPCSQSLGTTLLCAVISSFSQFLDGIRGRVLQLLLVVQLRYVFLLAQCLCWLSVRFEHF